MTTFVEARDAIVELVSTALTTDRPSLQVFWENTLAIDLDKIQGDRFLRIEIHMDDARQLTVNDEPIHRTYGTVYFTVFTREGTGTRATLELFQYLTDLAKFKRGARYTFGVVKPGKKDGRNGWLTQELVAPFFFESI